MGMSPMEPAKGQYRAGKINTKKVTYPKQGNVNRGASEAGGDMSFRRSNGNVKSVKGKGMNRNAY